MTCGPGKFGDKVVPDLWFEEACRVHDRDYADPTAGPKEVCDWRFLQNMLEAAAKVRTWAGRRLARRFAKLYYRMVSEYGGSAFSKARTPSLFKMRPLSGTAKIAANLTGQKEKNS